MKKDLSIIFGLFLLIAVLLIFGQGFTTASFLKEGTVGGQLQKRGVVSVNTKTLSIEAKVVSNATDRKKGLSKIDSLPLNEGMLFVFENPGRYGIWMKDMKFAIDIIWLDENKSIIALIADVPPEINKKDRELTIYKPNADAKYILEINAGLSRLHSLQVGDQARFELQ